MERVKQFGWFNIGVAITLATVVFWSGFAYAELTQLKVTVTYGRDERVKMYKLMLDNDASFREAFVAITNRTEYIAQRLSSIEIDVKKILQK